MAQSNSGEGGIASSTFGNDVFTVKDNRPTDFNRIKIGTPINTDTNTIMWDVNAFEPGELKRRGLLDGVPGEARSAVLVGSNDVKWQDTSGWVVSGSLELNAGIIDVLAKGSAEETKNACKRSSNVSIVGISEHRYKVNLRKGELSKKYFSCATENLKRILWDLEKELGKGNLHQALRCLTEFYQTYGTGVVCEVDLVAYGAFEAVLIRDSKAVQEVFSIAGGIAASVPFISGKIEGEYLKTHREDAVHTFLQTNSLGQPQAAEPYQWAFRSAEELRGHSLEEILKGEAWTAPDPKTVRSPDNPIVVPEKIDLTNLMDFPKLPGTIGDVVEFLKHNILGLPATTSTKAVAAIADSESPATPTADELHAAFLARQKQLKTFALYTQEDINKEAFAAPKKTSFKELQRSSNFHVLRLQPSVEDSNDGDNPTPGVGDDKPTPGAGDDKPGGEKVDPNVGTVTLDLSGWVPEGYSYRPWTDIFKELQMGPAYLTESQLVFGQSMEWLSMRRMFAQYLDFCSEFKGVVLTAKGAQVDINNQAEIFRRVLDAVGSDLMKRLVAERGSRGEAERKAEQLILVDPDTGLSFLQTLELKLEKMLNASQNDFRLYDHYRYWIQNFEWLKRIPFGVVAVVNQDDEFLYQVNPYPGCPIHTGVPEGFIRQPDRPSARELLSANAFRLYPIISTTPKTKTTAGRTEDGKPCFAWVGVPSKLKFNLEDESLRRSGLLSLKYRDPAQSPEGPQGDPGNWKVVPMNHWRLNWDDKTITPNIVMPMLIHQSPQAADELLSSEKDSANFEGSLRENGAQLTGAEALRERWNNRAKMFGLQLYRGVGGIGDDSSYDSGFGPSDRLLREQGITIDKDKDAARSRQLLQTAGTLAQKAAGFARVEPLPAEPSPTEESPSGADVETSQQNQDRYGPIWNVAGIYAAHSPRHQSVFFWGPEEGPGWKDDTLKLDQLPVQFVPVGYYAAQDAVATFLNEHEFLKGTPNYPGGPNPVVIHPDPKAEGVPQNWPENWINDWPMNAGGGPMWAKPNTELIKNLWKLAGTGQVPDVDF